MLHTTSTLHEVGSINDMHAMIYHTDRYDLLQYRPTHTDDRLKVHSMSAATYQYALNVFLRLFPRCEHD